MNDKDKFSLIPAQSLTFTSPPPAKANLLILPNPAFYQYKHKEKLNSLSLIPEGAGAEASGGDVNNKD